MSNETPLVSIIMPAYNAEKYIVKAIESVIEQTYSNWELYIIDDCSTDSTNEIIKRYTKRDTRIKIKTLRERQSIGLVRNEGLSMVLDGNPSSEYIAWIDADDIYHPRYLEILLEITKKYGCQIVECQSITFKNEVKRKDVFQNHIPETEQIIQDLKMESNDEYFLNWFDNKHKTSLWSKLFPVELFKGFKFPDEIMLEESYFYHYCNGKISKAISIPYVLYGYRNTLGSISRKFNAPYLHSLLNGIENSFNKMCNYPYDTVQVFYKNTLKRLHHNWNLALYSKLDKRLIKRIEKLIVKIKGQYSEREYITLKERLLYKFKWIPGYYSIRYYCAKIKNRFNFGNEN